jgi:tRNA G18 (ribose-2'-O)-methylase SpoU
MSQIIYGRHPVLAALKHKESQLEEIIIAQGASGPWLAELRRSAQAAGVKVHVQERAALDRLSGGATHQGVGHAGPASPITAKMSCWTASELCRSRPCWWPRTASPTP